VDASFFGRALPITAMLGDQQASLFAQGGFRSGTVKNTYGTGLFVVAGTGHKVVVSDKLVSTIAWSMDGVLSYGVEGSIFVGGSVIQWLRDGLKLLAKSEDSEAMAASLSDNEGVYFVPALVGLGAPHWRPDARGEISGLTRGTTPAHIVRAALESMAYQTRDVMEVLRASGYSFDRLCVDGGAAKNDFLMQFQADILDMDVERPVLTESTAFGVAGLSGIVSGFWSRDAFLGIRKVDCVFSPKMLDDVRQKNYDGWCRAIAKV
jgi:glycerol kinase